MSTESLKKEIAERVANLPDDCGAAERGIDPPGFAPAAAGEAPSWHGAPNEGRALVAFVYGLGIVLVHDGGEALLDVIADYSVQGELTTEEFDLSPPPDGVWLTDLRLVVDGPADGGFGGREVRLAMRQFRQPTRDEWEAHLDGSWPWPESGEPDGDG